MSAEALELADELEGFAEGSTSARASLMRDAANTIRALIPEPPTDDEWGALVSFLRRISPIKHEPLATKVAGEWATELLASPVWHNRHRGPITDEMVDAALSVLEEREHGMTSVQDDMRAALEAAEAHRA